MRSLRNLWTATKVCITGAGVVALVSMLIVLTNGEALLYSVRNFWRYSVLRIHDLSAEPPQQYSDPPQTGFPCSGLIPAKDGSGEQKMGIYGSCPPGWGIIANFDGGTDVYGRGSGPDVPVNGTCCRLPFDDILTDDHVFNVVDRCPDNYVFTSNTGNGRCGEACVSRCTRVNTEKYQLGPPQPSYYWKDRTATTFSGWAWAKRVYKDEIPLAIRQGVALLGPHRLSWDGCIGVPFGSLLVRKISKDCDGFIYRQLLYKDGTPVRIFPECRDVTGLDTPYPVCVP